MTIRFAIALFILVGCAGATEPPLPPEVVTALADPAIRQVDLPPGRWSGRITINRSNVRLIGRDTTIVPNGQLGVYVNSDFAEPGSGRIEHHATGTITAATDSLTLAEPCDIQVGDIVIVRCGVSYHDPAEPEAHVWQTVSGVNGDTVTFSLPFSRAVTVYPNYDAIVAISGEAWRFKTGAWEARPGYYSRGLGTDHGILLFSGRKPVENVTVEGVTVEWPKDTPAIYGAWSFSAQWGRRVQFRDIRVTNPRGSGVHLTACEQSGVDGLTLFGDGKSNHFNNPSHHSTSIAFSLWGGNQNYARNVIGEGRDLVLVNSEGGPSGINISNTFIRTSYSPGVWGATQFSVHGASPAFTISNARLDSPATSSSGLTPSTAPSSLEIKDLSFVSDAIPAWIVPSAYNFTGTIKVGNRTFGPKEYVSKTFVIATEGIKLEVPKGLYTSAQLTLDSRTGIRAITCPEEVFLTAPGALTLTLPSNRFGAVAPGPIDTYLNGLEIKVWLDAGAAPVRVKFEGQCYVE